MVSTIVRFRIISRRFCHIWKIWPPSCQRKLSLIQDKREINLSECDRVISWQHVGYWPKTDMTVRDSDVRFLA